MAIRSYIDCDRCGKAVQAGLTIRVDSVVLGVSGEPLNINRYGDTPQYAVCGECGESVREFLKGGTQCR